MIIGIVLYDLKEIFLINKLIINQRQRNIFFYEMRKKLFLNYQMKKKCFLNYRMKQKFSRKNY